MLIARLPLVYLLLIGSFNTHTLRSAHYFEDPVPDVCSTIYVPTFTFQYYGEAYGGRLVRAYQFTSSLDALPL